MKINAKLFGMNAVVSRLTKVLPAEVIKEIAQSVDKTADQIMGIARGKMGKKTGGTVAQLKKRKRRKGLTAQVGFFGDRAFIARFYQFGTKPHEIEPKNAVALRVGGRFVPRVMHPGQKAQDVILESTLAVRNAFQARNRAALVAALKRV